MRDVLVDHRFVVSEDHGAVRSSQRRWRILPPQPPEFLVNATDLHFTTRAPPARLGP